MSDGPLWIKWFPKHWLGEHALFGTNAATKGVWIDLLCVMAVTGNATVTGTRNDLAHLARCDLPDIDDFLNTASNTHFCDVTESNGVISITSRRMARDLKDYKLQAETAREKNRKRQQRFRDKHRNDNVTASDTGRNAVSNGSRNALAPASVSSSASNPSSQNRNKDRLPPGMQTIVDVIEEEHAKRGSR